MLERSFSTPGQRVTVETPDGAAEALVCSIPFEQTKS
jgi:hypothetical protein